VAVRVVDRLEPVEVPDDEAERSPLTTRARDLDLERLLEGEPVPEPGERVPARDVVGAPARLAQSRALSAEEGEDDARDHGENDEQQLAGNVGREPLVAWRVDNRRPHRHADEAERRRVEHGSAYS
jgi:hypothetical protein